MISLTVNGRMFKVRILNRTAYFQGGQFINNGELTLLDDGQSFHTSYSCPSEEYRSDDFYETADKLFTEIVKIINRGVVI